MELKEFIRQTLVQITEGVYSAKTECAKHGAVVNPKEYGVYSPAAVHNTGDDEFSPVQMIEFNVILSSVDGG